jgi:hypothetical protein
VGYVGARLELALGFYAGGRVNYNADVVRRCETRYAPLRIDLGLVPADCRSGVRGHPYQRPIPAQVTTAARRICLTPTHSTTVYPYLPR